jgi:mono/diheme cytochrome c family protein
VDIESTEPVAYDNRINQLGLFTYPSQGDVPLMARTALILSLLVLALAACAPAEQPRPIAGFDTLPAGDPARGEILFAQRIGDQPTCIGCHSLDGSRNVGPSILGYREDAAKRVPGQSPEQYTYESIISPWTHLVPGYNNVMPNRYGQVLTAQDAADLIAYLLSN